MQKNLILDSALIPKLKLENEPRKGTTEWSYDLKKAHFDVENPKKILHILQLLESCLPFFRFASIQMNLASNSNQLSDRQHWHRTTQQDWRVWFESARYRYNGNDDCEFPIILKMDLVLQDENQQVIELKEWYKLYFFYDNRPEYELFSLPFTIFAPSVLFENEKYGTHNWNRMSKAFQKLHKKMGATLTIDQAIPPLDKPFFEA